MPYTFADEDFRRIAVPIENRRGQLGPRARRVRANAARNRVDDDDDGGQEKPLLESQTHGTGVSGPGEIVELDHVG